MIDLINEDGQPDKQRDLNREEDGRNKEWQDRARVNLEQTPEGTHTNVERDFEPEDISEEANKKRKETPPPY